MGSWCGRRGNKDAISQHLLCKGGRKEEEGNVSLLLSRPYLPKAQARLPLQSWCPRLSSKHEMPNEAKDSSEERQFQGGSKKVLFLMSASESVIDRDSPYGGYGRSLYVPVGLWLYVTSKADCGPNEPWWTEKTSPPVTKSCKVHSEALGDT